MDNMLFGVLERHNYGDVQTTGEFKLQGWDNNDLISLKTLEKPWRDNEQRESCIPESRYDVRIRKPHESGKFNYEHFLIQDVPDRSYILFHSGNFHYQIAGCVLVGKDFKDINEDGTKDVISSRDALRELLDTVKSYGEEGFMLKIVSTDER